jgi:hypothetical protein
MFGLEQDILCHLCLFMVASEEESAKVDEARSCSPLVFCASHSENELPLAVEPVKEVSENNAIALILGALPVGVEYMDFVFALYLRLPSSCLGDLLVLSASWESLVGEWRTSWDESSLSLSR